MHRQALPGRSDDFDRFFDKYCEWRIMRQVVFLASTAVWEHGHGPNHPLKPIRLQRTYELLEEYGAFQPEHVQLVAPRQATAAR